MYARTQEDWRFVSSTARSAMNFNPDLIADFKRQKFQVRLTQIAKEVGMDKIPEAFETFMRKWCEHKPGDETLRAEMEPTFNIRDRAIQWMAWWNRNEERRAPQQPKSRSDKFDEEMNKIDAFFDGFYGRDKQQPSGVDEQ